MKGYFAYIRVSTAKQGERGSSLQEQRNAIEQYAIRENLSIVEWFEERETAAKLGRTVFTRMLGRLERGNARGLIVHKIDRSARNLKDWANLGTLIDKGVDVRFAHDSLDLHSRGGRLAADLQAVVAADYIRNLREEVLKGLQGRLNQGIYPFAAPVGYLDMGKAKPKAPDPVNAPLVREAFELYATGTVGLKDLRVEMNRRGLRAPRSTRPLSLNGISKMLNNPFYVGLIRIKRTGSTYEGKHEAIVPLALFERVQQILRGKLVARVYKHDFLFRRMVKCANCGLHVIGERQKQSHIYYRCHGEACGASIREDLLDHLVQTTLAKLMLDAREQGALREIAAKLTRNTVDDLTALRRSLRLRVAQCEERLQRLMDAYLERAIERDLFERNKHGVLMERQALNERIAGLTAEDAPANRALKKLELGSAALLSYKMGNRQEKRDLVQSLTSNFFIQGKSPTFELLSPFREIANWREFHKSAPTRLSPWDTAQQLLDICIAIDEKERKSSDHKLAA